MLDIRELGTVLAALRNWQLFQDAIAEGARPTEEGAAVLAIARDGGIVPLSNAEIDQLCERLNGGLINEDHPTPTDDDRLIRAIFGDVAAGGNAGCDNCGQADRLPNSVLCAHCLANETGHGS